MDSKDLLKGVSTYVSFKVTTELYTPIWKKFLRWCRLCKKRNEFSIVFAHDFPKIGDILEQGGGNKVLVISSEYRFSSDLAHFNK